MDIKEKIHKKLYTFSINLVGKHAIDLYMSKRKINILETNTRIPLILLSGKRLFLKYIKSRNFFKNISNTVVFEPLIYNYLKLGGFRQEKISYKTNVPIGIIKLIYFMYINNIDSENGYLDKFIKRYIGYEIPLIFKNINRIDNLKTSTLIPIALITNKKELYRFFFLNKDSRVLYINYKFIKDPLLNEYFNFINMYNKKVYLSTLVPLGLLLVLYHLYCV